MKLTEKQLWSIAKSTARINVWEGSVRSGKTIAADHRFAKAVVESDDGLPPDYKDMLIGKTVTSLRRNVINPLCELFGNEAVYYPGKQELVLMGQPIEILGANDERAVGKIQGSTLRKVYGDELALWSKDFWNMLNTRMSTERSQFFGTTNPGPPRHFLKVDVLNKKRELDVESFHFKMEDNPTLPPHYVEQMEKSIPGLLYKRLVKGLWCLAEGAIYDFFDEDEHLIVQAPQAKYYILAIDPGFTHPFGAVLQGVNRDARPKIWTEQEFYWVPSKKELKKTSADLSKELKDACERWLGPYWKSKVRKTYIDPSHEAFEAQLRKDRFPGVTEAKNSVIPGIDTVAIMQKNYDYAVHQRCKNLINERYTYVWCPKAQEKGEDAPLKEMDDLSDAERYGVFSEFGGEIPNLDILSRF